MWGKQELAENCEETEQTAQSIFNLLKRKEREREMGYVLRVKMASFFAGAATASLIGLYLLHEDYKAAHHSISQKVKLCRFIPIPFGSFFVFLTLPCDLFISFIYYNFLGAFH